MAVIPKQSAFTVDQFEDVTLGPISCGPPRVNIKGAKQILLSLKVVKL